MKIDTPAEQNTTGSLFTLILIYRLYNVYITSGVHRFPDYRGSGNRFIYTVRSYKRSNLHKYK